MLTSTTISTQQPAETLHRLLTAEDRIRRENARKATSRHSRFGTTIAVKLNPNKKLAPPRGDGNEADSEQTPAPSSSASSSRAFVLHRQQAISRESGSIMDIGKKQNAKRGTKVDELTREDNLSLEARVVLQTLAVEFVQACFNREWSLGV